MERIKDKQKLATWLKRVRTGKSGPVTFYRFHKSEEEWLYSIVEWDLEEYAEVVYDHLEVLVWYLKGKSKWEAIKKK